jgi:tetratricopeptide (TPR) repeat protein
MQKLDAPMAELFSIHDRLAELVRENLSVAGTISPPQARPRLSAYECYARGQRLFKKLEKGSMDQGLELYEKAIELDPRCAPALTGLASIHALRFVYTSDTAVLDRAISMPTRDRGDPVSGEPHAWLGYALWRAHRTTEADEELSRPSSTRRRSGGPISAPLPPHLLWRTDDALAFSHRAIELEPKAAFWYGLGSLHLELETFRRRLSYEQAQRVNILPDASPFPDVVVLAEFAPGRQPGSGANLCLEVLNGSSSPITFGTLFVCLPWLCLAQSLSNNRTLLPQRCFHSGHCSVKAVRAPWLGMADGTGFGGPCLHGQGRLITMRHVRDSPPNRV